MMRIPWKSGQAHESPQGVIPVSLRARMMHGVGWNTVGTVFNQGSTFAINIVLAHLLGPRAFGQYAMIQTTLAVVASMAQVGSGYTATKFLAEYRDRDPERAGRVLGLCATVAVATGLAAAVTLFVGARWLASVTLDEPELAPGLMIAAGIVLFSVLNGFLTGALAGLERYRALGKAGIIGGMLYIVFCALGGWLGGVTGALTGAALTALIHTLILRSLAIRLAAARRILVHWRGAWEERDILLRFSIPAALNGFVSLPAIWVASALLARQANGFEQLALFTAANNFRIILLFLPNVVNAVGMSVLNNQRGLGEETSFRRLFWANLSVTAGIVVIGGSILALWGRPLLGLFGPEFQAAYPVLRVLIVAAVAESLALAAFQSVQSHGRLWQSFMWAAVPGYSVLVIAAMLLVPEGGALGLAWAYLACWTVGLAANWLLVWRLGVWSSPVGGKVS